MQPSCRQSPDLLEVFLRRLSSQSLNTVLKSKPKIPNCTCKYQYLKQLKPKQINKHQLTCLLQHLAIKVNRLGQFNTKLQLLDSILSVGVADDCLPSLLLSPPLHPSCLHLPLPIPFPPSSSTTPIRGYWQLTSMSNLCNSMAFDHHVI